MLKSILQFKEEELQPYCKPFETYSYEAIKLLKFLLKLVMLLLSFGVSQNMNLLMSWVICIDLFTNCWVNAVQSYLIS